MGLIVPNQFPRPYERLSGTQTQRDFMPNGSAIGSWDARVSYE